MTMALFFHILAAAIWLGCVLTETLGEHGGVSNAELKRFVSVTHVRWDLWIEAPALVVVAASGLWLLGGATVDATLAVKIACGGAAVVANLACIGLVLHRARAARADDWANWTRLDILQHKVGAVVLFGLVAALALGGARLIAS